MIDFIIRCECDDQTLTSHTFRPHIDELMDTLDGNENWEACGEVRLTFTDSFEVANRDPGAKEIIIFVTEDPNYGSETFQSKTVVTDRSCTRLADDLFVVVGKRFRKKERRRREQRMAELSFD